MDEPVNFLFIITDQHRADYLGCYGHPVLQTPHIDRIAAGGTRFDRFYVANPVCMPNRATLVTGRMSSIHGVRHNGLPLPARANTFLDVLRAHGYRTALLGKSHLQPFTDRPPALGENPAGSGPLANAVRDDARYDLESPEFWAQPGATAFPSPFYGFDHVDLVTGHGDTTGGHYLHWLREVAPEALHLRGPAAQLAHDYVCPQAVRTALPEELYSTAYIRDRALDYLTHAAQGGGPFFAFVSFPDPHHPFNPPGRYWERYQPGQMTLPPSFHAHRNPPPHLRWAAEQWRAGSSVRTSQSAFMVSEREAREAMALTCGMIAMIDDAVGALLERLEATGLAGRTVIVFTSDHGDFMGDHGLMLKGPMHFQGLVRIPFLWKEPRRRTVPHSPALAGTVDIARTVLARAGATPYVGMQGLDLAPALAGGALERRRLLVEDDGNRAYLGFAQAPRLRTLITERHRLSVYLDEDWGELYDLAEDPHETGNLWDRPDCRALREELQAALLQELMRVVERSPWPDRVA